MISYGEFADHTDALAEGADDHVDVVFQAQMLDDASSALSVDAHPVRLVDDDARAMAFRDRGDRLQVAYIAPNAIDALQHDQCAGAGDLAFTEQPLDIS